MAWPCKPNSAASGHVYLPIDQIRLRLNLVVRPQVSCRVALCGSMARFNHHGPDLAFPQPDLARAQPSDQLRLDLVVPLKTNNVVYGQVLAIAEPSCR